MTHIPQVYNPLNKKISQNGSKVLIPVGKIS